MCISIKILDMLYLIFISAHMVLKEKFGQLAQIHPYYDQCQVWWARDLFIDFFLLVFFNN